MTPSIEAVAESTMKCMIHAGGVREFMMNHVIIFTQAVTGLAIHFEVCTKIVQDLLNWLKMIIVNIFATFVINISSTYTITEVICSKNITKKQKQKACRVFHIVKRFF